MFANPNFPELTPEGTYNVINEERGGDKRHFESDELVALFALLRRQRIIRGTGVCTRYHRRVKNSMEIIGYLW